LDRSTGGLMYYGARYYLPELRRFISADSIVPGATNPQAFNRYSYTLNNPIKYVDPTGHHQCDSDPDPAGCYARQENDDNESNTTSDPLVEVAEAVGDLGDGENAEELEVAEATDPVGANQIENWDMDTGDNGDGPTIIIDPSAQDKCEEVDCIGKTKFAIDTICSGGAGDNFSNALCQRIESMGSGLTVNWDAGVGAGAHGRAYSDSEGEIWLNPNWHDDYTLEDPDMVKISFFGHEFWHAAMQPPGIAGTAWGEADAYHAAGRLLEEWGYPGEANATFEQETEIRQEKHSIPYWYKRFGAAAHLLFRSQSEMYQARVDAFAE